MDRLTDAKVGWLTLALVLHVCGQACRGLAWRGVLRAAWPGVTRRRACAWHVCGAGLSGVLSVRGGDAVRMTLAKREIPEASWAALGGTLAVEGSFEVVCGIVLAFVAAALGVKSLGAPSPILVGLLVVAAVMLLVLALRSERVRGVVREVRRGFAVLKQIRASRPAAKRISLARFKEILREQYLLVRLDQERALGAVPKLLGDDDAARKATLDVLHRVLAARGDLSDEEKRRLTRVDALFGALPAKAARTETAHA